MTTTSGSMTDRAREARVLLERILVEAPNEAEELPALWRACTEGIPLPADAHVVGEPVSVEAFAWDGNTRRGLTAECRVRGGSRYVVGAAELVFPGDSPGARVLDAYRAWLGLPPVEEGGPGVPSRRRHTRTGSTFRRSASSPCGPCMTGPGGPRSS